MMRAWSIKPMPPSLLRLKMKPPEVKAPITRLIGDAVLSSYSSSSILGAFGLFFSVFESGYETMIGHLLLLRCAMAFSASSGSNSQM